MEFPTDGTGLDEARLLAARPKLKADSVLLEAQEGAYLRNGDRAFVVKGKSAYRWLATLSPYLDGGRPLSEICRDLDPAHRATLLSLVDTLTSRGFAKDVGDPEPDDLLPAAVMARFGSQIEYVDHFVDQPRRRFHNFRTARVLATGRGEPLIAAILALIRNGLSTVDLMVADGPEQYVAAAEADVEALHADGVASSVRLVSTMELSEYDAVVFCSDESDLRQMLDLNRRAHAGGPLVVPAIVGGEQAVLGPVVRQGAAPCWLCAQLRLTTNADASFAADRWRDLTLGQLTGSAQPVPATVARMMGNAAAFELFRLLTGALPGDSAQAVVVQDLQTLESVREGLLPHPLCPVCRPAALASVATVADPVGISDQDVNRRCERLVGRRVGLLIEASDDPLEQAPLCTARLRLGVGRPGSGAEPRTLTAFAIEDLLTARLAAYRLAVREYVSLLAPDPGALTATAEELTALGRLVVLPEQLDTWSGLPVGAGRVIEWVPATILGSPEPALVPAAAVYPFSAANAGVLVERTPAGSAAGANRDAAIAAGLASACAYRALRGAVAGHGAVAPVASDRWAGDEQLAFLDKSARRFGATIRVFELSEAAPAHAALAVVGGDGDDTLWVVGSGNSSRAAVVDALRDAVGLVQVRHFEGVTADIGAPLLADADPRMELRHGDPPAGRSIRAAAADWPAMCGELRDRGLTALFVDTTPRDVRSVQALVVGTVLLCRLGAAE